jgi:murein DD-endopeptidase MepM/ murein hydrolase activator NlpD
VLAGLLAVVIVAPSVAGGAVTSSRSARVATGQRTSASVSSSHSSVQLVGDLAAARGEVTARAARLARSAARRVTQVAPPARAKLSRPETARLVAAHPAPVAGRAAGKSTGPAPSIQGDRATIAQLERELVSEGALAENLVTVEDVAAAHAYVVQQRLARADRRLAGDRAEQAAIARELASDAVAEYVNSGNATSMEALVAPGGVGGGGSGEAAVYADAAAGALTSLITGYGDAQHRVTVARVRVDRELRAARAALGRVRAARSAADAAVRSDNALLEGTRHNLGALLAAAAARRAAIEEAEEETLAAHPAVKVSSQAASSQVVVVPRPPVVPSRVAIVPTATASPLGDAGYSNPLRGVAALTPERIDQGVDYCGAGPVYAMGDGTVLSTYNGGWPGGTFITYQLTSGPAAGLVVYVAEDLNPEVSPGQDVTSDTVVGTLYEGPNCMETGWADGGAGDTMAMVAEQFSGANSTAFGLNYSELLQTLGAPAGVLQNPVASGSLPGGWPSW